MKTKSIVISLFFLLFGSISFAQPGSGNMKPPTIEERLKMINEKICQPLKLDKNQTAKVVDAYKVFFIEMDKLIDFKSNPPKMPEKSKADALAKIRDDKVKKIIPNNLYVKYEELEKTTRPPQPPR